MDKKFIDVNTHEFTLQALSDLFTGQEKLRRSIKRVKFGSKVSIGLVCVVGYYVYDNLNQRIKELEELK